MTGDDITPVMTIEKLIELYPQASGFFLRFGIRCFTCSGVIWGTIEETLRRKGIKDIDSAVDELRCWVRDHSDEV